MPEKVTKREKENLVEQMVFFMMCYDEYSDPKPGAVVKRFLKNKRNREIIESLTAEDFNHRVDWMKLSTQSGEFPKLLAVVGAENVSSNLTVDSIGERHWTKDSNYA